MQMADCKANAQMPHVKLVDRKGGLNHPRTSKKASQLSAPEHIIFTAQMKAVGAVPVPDLHLQGLQNPLPTHVEGGETWQPQSEGAYAPAPAKSQPSSLCDPQKSCFWTARSVALCTHSLYVHEVYSVREPLLPVDIGAYEPQQHCCCICRLLHGSNHLGLEGCTKNCFWMSPSISISPATDVSVKLCAFRNNGAAQDQRLSFWLETAQLPHPRMYWVDRREGLVLASVDRA